MAENLIPDLKCFVCLSDVYMSVYSECKYLKCFNINCMLYERSYVKFIYKRSIITF